LCGTKDKWKDDKGREGGGNFDEQHLSFLFVHPLPSPPLTWRDVPTNVYIYATDQLLLK
jgi:hypothetical protein